MVNLGNDWQEMIGKEFEKEYYLKLRTFLKTEYQTQTIYPSMYDIFNALRLTSYSQVKAVILGQDPYHQPNQAHGLCFSVKPNVKIPPSLSNIFKELNEDLGIAVPEHGCLIPWAKQGVLLLNAILTVRAGKPMSHRGQGWEIFTDEVLIQLNKRQKPVIFMLWGSPARKKVNLITNPIHYILEAPHPSPLSAHYGFFGSRHFSKANKILQELGQTSINWDLNS